MISPTCPARLFIKRIGLAALAVVCFDVLRADAQTVLHTVTTSTEFAQAIADVNGDPTSDHRIEIVGTITMAEQVQAIDVSGYEDTPELLALDEDAELTVTGEVIEE